jgi:REP element-mobilizing transposase RayT
MKKTFLKTANRRNMEIGQIYFYTATINNWQPLLALDYYKDIIVSSWENLSQRGKIDVFAFVIMPTHLHSIWRMNEYNGKESPQGSFLKFTAHQFKKLIPADNRFELAEFQVDAYNKEYELWQTDQLAIPLYSRKVAYQKLNYIHNNPVTKNWRLANSPVEYKYSSARYYNSNKTEFSFLKNLWQVL